MNSPDPDGSDKSVEKAPAKTLALDTAKNPETDIVSDYFKDHNYIKMLKSMFTLTIEGTIKKILMQNPGWRLKTYQEYYSDYRGGEAYYVTALSQKYIPTIDRCAGILNEEIANCETGGTFNEERFRTAWNETNFAVFGCQNSQI